MGKTCERHLVIPPVGGRRGDPVPHTILGAFITFSESLLYAAYGEVEQPFGISLLTDQQLGGLVLWLPGDMMSILAAGIVMGLWYQQEQAKERAEEVMGEVS